MSEDTFRQQMHKIYKTNERVIRAMIESEYIMLILGFKQHKVQELTSSTKSEKVEIEFLEVLIAMVLLARVRYDKKLRCK